MANKSIHADRDNVRSTTEAKETRLEERIGKLEKENTELQEWISDMEGENAKLLKRPSIYHASEFRPFHGSSKRNGSLMTLE